MKNTHTSDTFTQASLAELASFKGQPCLSLYQPTHRFHPDNQQDPIRCRHLVKTLETSMQQQHSSLIVKTLIEPFESLAKDKDFWNHTLDSLVVLGASGLFRVFLLQRPVTELAMVADSFHTKPLRQWLQSTERYQVLALSLDKVQLYEGDCNALNAVALDTSMLKTMSAAAGNEFTEPHSTVSSYGGLGGGQVATHHGKGSKKEEIDSDAERFFRSIDRAVLEHHSRSSGLPLILAALPEHHHLFRDVSHNPFLMTSGLMVDPQSLTHDDLRQRSWEVMSPQVEAQQTAWSDAYEISAGKGLGSENLSQIAHAAVAGRVATLLIEAERHVAGLIDGSTGRIDPADLDNPRADDVFDDLGALVESMGGEVHVLSADRMPCQTGAAASFRH